MLNYLQTYTQKSLALARVSMAMDNRSSKDKHPSWSTGKTADL